MNIKEKTFIGVIWNYAQNIGTQVVNFVVSIIIARILSPSEYGLVSLTSIFTTIANVFVTTGFSAAIIQRKDITDKQKNSMFYANVVVGILLYIILFLTSPFIASFCKESALTNIIRIQSIAFLLASAYSVPQALLSREMDFKRIAIIRCSGVIVHGIVGIVLALLGFGAYALVISTIANNACVLIITYVIVKWRPEFEFSFASIKEMLSYSTKVLGTNLVNTIYNNISSLFVGRVYNSEQLGFYNRGYSFPTVIMVAVDGTISTVMFPAMSAVQNDKPELCRILRRTIQISMFICAPLMIGLLGVAKPMVLVLLTEKWLESVPYIQLMAIVCLSWPLSAGIQILNAMGKSGVTFVISTIEKVFGIILLLCTVSISVPWVLYSTMIATFLGLLMRAIAYKKYFDYRIMDQIIDVLKPVCLSCCMLVPIYLLNHCDISEFLVLVLDILVGILVYVAVSYMFNRKSFIWLLTTVKSKFLKER